MTGTKRSNQWSSVMIAENSHSIPHLRGLENDSPYKGGYNVVLESSIKQHTAIYHFVRCLDQVT